MKVVKGISIGCLGILAVLAVVAVILWRGGTGIDFLDSAINGQKRALIAGQCVERAGLPKPQCDCFAGELATLPVSDVMLAIQSAQSGNPTNISGEVQKHGDLIKNSMNKCGFTNREDNAVTNGS